MATSLRDIEALRNNATNLGIMTSIAAFGLNEVARLTLRSRKYYRSLIDPVFDCQPYSSWDSKTWLFSPLHPLFWAGTFTRSKLASVLKTCGAFTKTAKRRVLVALKMQLTSIATTTISMTAVSASTTACTLAWTASSLGWRTHLCWTIPSQGSTSQLRTIRKRWITWMIRICILRITLNV